MKYPSLRLDSAILHYLVDLRFKVKGGLYFLLSQKVAKTFKKNFIFDFFTLDSAKNSVDSAPSKHETNSSIVDEFLGLCEASDEDRTLVHRGSEPTHSLKSRYETQNL